ncbi:hypothetical protein ACGRHY_18975 [Streptomyces sp. HK10]|uniref:hypothetical protein n=1 Tax=Streptomyces sp. HK10 TaxID=3373255 RepID=UPI003749DE33
MTQPNILSFGASGWIRVTWSDRPYRVLARTVERDGRRVIADLVIRSDGHVDSKVMKKVPVSWLESTANVPDRARQLSAGESGGGSNTPSGTPMSSVLDELEIAIDGMAMAALSTQEPVTRERLARPDGTNPEEFYAHVASAYHDVVQRTSAVAPVLAEEAGVPVATVRRWIQESRRRGFLPPARRGRAG